jgi:hypothetical protein
MIGIEYAVGAQVEVPIAAAEPLITIDQLAERSAALRAGLAADRRWVAAERPYDMGNDLMVGLGIMAMDAVRQQRQRSAA